MVNILNLSYKFLKLAQINNSTFSEIKKSLINWIIFQFITHLNERLNIEAEEKLKERNPKFKENFFELKKRINNLTPTISNSENFLISLNDIINNFEKPSYVKKLLKLKRWPEAIPVSIYPKTDFLDFIQWDKENHEIIVFFNVKNIWSREELNSKLKHLIELIESRIDDIVAEINQLINSNS